MIKQIFRTDRKYWTQSHCDQVEVFFQLNKFYSKFYEHKDFDKIIGMTYYAKIQKNQPVFLENSKRPETVILLSGKIQISKKINKQSGNKKSKRTSKSSVAGLKIEQNAEQQYQILATLSSQNQSAIVQTQCKVEALDKKQAQILFVPSILYNQHIKYLDDQRIQILYKGLRQFYPDIQRKFLIRLAKSGCYYKEFRINDYIYRAGSLPQQVYLLIEGNVKLEKPGFSAKKMFEMLILNPKSIFGEKDIKLNQRQKNAISCSAYARTLIIPKTQFLRFAKQFLPNLVYLKEQQLTLSLPILEKKKNNSLYAYQKMQNKPRFLRFHSSSKFDNQVFIQTKLIKNCHILVNLSPKGSRTSRLQGKTQSVKDYSKDQFKEKIKFYNKIRPNIKKLDIQNPMFDCTPKRNYSSKSEKTSQD